MKTGFFLTVFGLLLATDPSFAGQRRPLPELAPAVPASKNDENSTVSELKGTASTLADPRHKNEILDYARKVLLALLGFAGMPEPPAYLTKAQHACFVTFFSGKRVFACFGGFYPRTGNTAEEIAENIRLALIYDSRARNIDKKTAMTADVQITFPGEPRAVYSYSEVNPYREGLLVENDVDGVAIVPGEAKTASWAYREAMRRLGEKDRSRIRLFKFHAFALSSRK